MYTSSTITDSWMLNLYDIIIFQSLFPDLFDAQIVIIMFSISYFADSQRWVDLGTSRDIWPHTPCSACPAERYPTAAPRTRSSKSEWWRSTPQSYVGWCRRWDIWGPEGSSYRRESSTRLQRKRRRGVKSLSAWCDRFRSNSVKRALTSSSLWRVLDVRAEVIPAFLEFWTKDWATGERRCHVTQLPIITLCLAMFF